MGIYTTNFGLYKPDATENVDVDSQVNRNLDIIDSNMKPLMEWQRYDGSSISGDSALVKKHGYRFYKTYSNSIWFYNATTDSVLQGLDNFCPSWKTLTAVISAGYTGVGVDADPSGPDWPHLCQISRSVSASDIEMSGKIRLSTSAELPLNTTTTIISNLPTDMRPLEQKNFITASPGGSSVQATYSITRIVVNTNGTVTYYRMGDNVGAVNSLHYISLDGVRYSTDVTP